MKKKQKQLRDEILQMIQELDDISLQHLLCFLEAMASLQQAPPGKKEEIV